MEQIKTLLRHRLFLSVALTETSAVHTLRVRTAYLVAGVIFLMSGWLVTAIGGPGVNLAGARLAASITGNTETKYYLDMITELRAQRDAEKEQVKLIAQELGVLQARLDRFDALGNKLRAEGTLLSEAIPEEGAHEHGHSQGGPEVYHLGQSNAPDMDEIKEQLGLMARRADVAEIALETSLALAIRKSLGSSIKGGGIPYFWPLMVTKQRFASSFGWRKDPFTGQKKWHSGSDFAAAQGSPIVAAADGVVTYSGWRVGYGNLVEIKHENGFFTRYGHCSRAIAKVGDRVDAGDLIALVGSTGRSTGPHLHFEVIKDGNRLNPLPFVKDTRTEVIQQARAGRGNELISTWRDTKRTASAK